MRAAMRKTSIRTLPVVTKLQFPVLRAVFAWDPADQIDAYRAEGTGFVITQAAAMVSA